VVADAVRAFWCRTPSRPNFGDALTPWMIRRLTGVYPRFARPDDPVPKYLVAGSIIAYADHNCTVWGSGIMYRRDVISPHARFLAVRGLLTRERAIECGASCPDVLGDPALLLPRLYRPAPADRQGIGLVPHFSDAQRVLGSWRPGGDFRLIDVQSGVETFIDQITSCELVVSSSLHGLIASHAYGIPALWVKFRDLPSGDDSKFADYFASIGHGQVRPVRVNHDRLRAGDLARAAVPPDIQLDLEPLWESCPFRGGAT